VQEDDVAWDHRNRQAVEAVLLDYCEFVDALDYEGVAGLFTEYGEFDLGFGRVSRGRQGVKEQIRTRVPTEYTHTSHHLTNIRISFDGRDRATARSYVMAWHRQARDGRERRLYGRYYDDLVLTPQGWKIRRRLLKMAGEDGYPAVAGQPTAFELIDRLGRDPR
jgi:3-phenylpropionate/cinnamic acid dioxygenase small subunit